MIICLLILRAKWSFYLRTNWYTFRFLFLFRRVSLFLFRFCFVLFLFLFEHHAVCVSRLLKFLFSVHLPRRSSPFLSNLGGLSPGKLVSTTNGKVTAHALAALQERGKLFVSSGQASHLPAPGHV